MFQFQARKLLLALALLAVAGGTMLPSGDLASAASPPPTESLRDNNPPPTPTPTKPGQQPPVKFTAALKVKHELTTQLPNGNGTTYVFKVQNNGLNVSGPITLERGWWWSAGLGAPLNGHMLAPTTIPSLGPGESTLVGMFCHEPVFTVCWGGGVRVSAPNDNTPGDNFANSGNAAF